MGNKSTNIISGVFVLFLGVMYLLGELSMTPEFSIFKIFILAIVIILWVKAIFRKSRTGIIYYGGIGYYYIAINFNFPTISLWSILVFATFLNIGLSLIFRKNNDYDFRIDF